MKNLLWGAVVVAALCAACGDTVSGTTDGSTPVDPGGGGNTNNNGGATSFTVAALCTEAADLSCESETRCLIGSPATKANCVAEAALSCEKQFGRRLRAGVLAIDNAAAARCVQGAKAASCDAPGFVPPECGEIFVEDGGAGASCQTSGDCRNGVCQGGGGAACAACVDYLADLTSCAGAGQCKPTSRCLSDGGATECVPKQAEGTTCASATDCFSNTCRFYSDIGESRCGLRPAGQPCGSVNDCQTARCGSVGSSPDGGTTCLAKVADGQACVSTSECAGRYSTCVNNKCDAIDYFSRKVDAGCGSDNHCQQGLGCQFQGSGTFCRPTGASIGDPCFNPGSECNRYLVCRPEVSGGTNKCLKYIDVNNLCDNSLGGALNNFCTDNTQCRQRDGGSGSTDTACLPDPGPGQPCFQGTCFGGFCGTDGGCQAFLNLGQQCTSSTFCQTESCATFDGGTPTCNSCF